MNLTSFKALQLGYVLVENKAYWILANVITPHQSCLSEIGLTSRMNFSYVCAPAYTVYNLYVPL